MHAGHDPHEPMSIVVPEGEVGAAREALDLPDDPLSEQHVQSRSRTRTLVVGRLLIWLVIFVLVSALLRGPLSDVLPFVGGP